MRLVLWRSTGDEPTQVQCSTENWVGDLQPLAEEPFRLGDYVEAHIGKTHFHTKTEALQAVIRNREETLKDLDLQEKIMKEQLKEAKARATDAERSLEALAKMKETA